MRSNRWSKIRTKPRSSGVQQVDAIINLQPLQRRYILLSYIRQKPGHLYRFRSSDAVARSANSIGMLRRAALRQLRQIRNSVPTATFQSLVVDRVISRLDYGNDVLVGVPTHLHGTPGTPPPVGAECSRTVDLQTSTLRSLSKPCGPANNWILKCSK